MRAKKTGRRSGLTAADIMSTELVTVPLGCTLQGLAVILNEHHISGAPVVDDSGTLVGVVSQSDLVRYDMRHHSGTPQALHAPRGIPRDPEDDEADASATPSTYHTHLDEADLRALGRSFIEEDFGDATVADIFTPFAITAPVDAPLAMLARLMVEKDVHRILVVNGGKVAGIVTSMDLLRTMARPRQTSAEAARPCLVAH